MWRISAELVTIVSSYGRGGKNYFHLMSWQPDVFHLGFFLAPSRCVRFGRRQRRRAAGHRREVAPCQDRRADAGKRFFGRSARQSRFVERKAMINREHDLPITKQAQVLRISRGSVYYLRARCRTPMLRSCGVSTGCIWSFLSPARGCCEACWLPRGARSAVVTSRR